MTEPPRVFIDIVWTLKTPLNTQKVILAALIFQVTNLVYHLWNRFLEFAPSFEELDPILLRLLNSGNRRVIVYNRDFVQAVFNYNCSLYGLPPLGLVTAAHKAKLDPKYNPRDSYYFDFGYIY